MIEPNKTLVREITEQIWNAGALDRIPDFYSVKVVNGAYSRRSASTSHSTK
jgi:hypothetical protein